MGFRKNWDVADITTQLHALARECSSPYNDRFTAFYAKQDLYQIKAIVDTALAESPDFGDLEKSSKHSSKLALEAKFGECSGDIAKSSKSSKYSPKSASRPMLVNVSEISPNRRNLRNTHEFFPCGGSSRIDADAVQRFAGKLTG